MSEERIAIAVVKMSEAERFKTLLAKRGVEIVFYHNQQTCQSGCATTVEIHAKVTDIEKIREFFSEEKNRLLDGFDFDPSLAGQVFDPSKDTATCPACGTEFSTKSTECPDCGLNF